MNIHTAAGVAATSSDVYKKQSPRKAKNMLDFVEETVRDAQRKGLKDMTGKEIQEAINEQHGRFIEMSTLSGVIRRLLDGNRLTTDPKNDRMCRVTGTVVRTVSAPAIQATIAGVY